MSDRRVAWVRAQLDATEAAAKAATPGPWRWNPDKHWRKPGTAWFEEAVFAGAEGKAATCVAGTGEDDDPQSMADARHIALHDPAAVLADVEAKRAILEACVDKLEYAETTTDIDRYGAVDLAERTVRLLAEGFRHRDGYEEAMRDE